MNTFKWRVERVGSASSGYGPGWIAMDGEATRGAVFATFDEAITFARHHARAELDRHGKRALMKLGHRGVKGAGYPSEERAPKLEPRKRPYRRVTDAEIRAAAAMHDNNRSWSEIADALGLNKATIFKAVARTR